MSDQQPIDILAAFERLRPVLQAAPLGLFCDVDGTLSPITPTPEEAIVPAATVAALERLGGRAALVAAVSGRPVREVRERLPLATLVIVGNHGFERWTRGETEIPADVRPYLESIDRLLAQVSDGLDLPGVRIENKGPTATLHYRACADPDAARDRLLQRLAELNVGADFEVTGGRRVIEIRPGLPYNKGTAVRDLIEERGLAGAIYIGDDWTDVHAFKTLRAWREGGGGRAFTVAVASDEADPDIAAAADGYLAGQAQVRDFLDRINGELAGDSA